MELSVIYDRLSLTCDDNNASDTVLTSLGQSIQGMTDDFSFRYKFVALQFPVSSYIEVQETWLGEIINVNIVMQMVPFSKQDTCTLKAFLWSDSWIAK